MKNILLLSGGKDSLLIHSQQPKDFFDDRIYFDYGQEYKEKELAVLKTNKIQVDVKKIQELKAEDGGFFPGRNFLFLQFMKVTQEEDTTVWIGTNASDKFPDNNPRFFKRACWVLNRAYKGPKLKVKLPLSHLTNEQVLEAFGETKLKAFGHK